VNLSLRERSELARRLGARVFISLHANSGRSQARGSEVYVHSRAGAGSRALASMVQRSLARLGGACAGVLAGELAVLSPDALAPQTAACLLEVDYLSHPDGERRLRDPAALDRLGRVLATAVREFLDDPSENAASAGARFGVRGQRRYGRPSPAASALVTTAGSADAADAALVADEVDKFPSTTLSALSTLGSRFVVCRGSVTDYLTTLRGVRPRGWPPGSTWDTVPGLNDSSRSETVIAVIGHGTAAGAHVPLTGEGHGSYNLVLHEGSHGVDLNGQVTARSTAPNFLASRTADIGTLSAYETQAGDAGQQETYAESGARYFGSDPNDATQHPTLHAYWASHIPGPSSDPTA
jgi:hypothetical protein